MENVKELVEALKDPKVQIHCLVDVIDFELFNLKYGFENGNYILHQISSIAKDELDSKYWIHLGGSKYYFSSAFMRSNSLYFEESIIRFRDRIINEVTPIVSINILVNKKLPAFILFWKLKSVLVRGRIENEDQTVIFYCG